MSGTHVFATHHKDAPNSACHRALVLNPFTCKAQCEQKGIPYNCCKIPDHQMRPSKLIESVTTDTITCGDGVNPVGNPNPSGAAFFKITPAIEFMGVSSMNTAPFADGTSVSLANSDAANYLSSYGAYRCVAIGLEIEPTDSIMDISGKIAIGTSPWVPFPANQYVGTSMPSTVRQVQALEGAITVGCKESAHCAWTPDSSGVTWFQNGSANAIPLYWHYTDFIPIGYNSAGGKVTTVAAAEDPYAIVFGAVGGGATYPLQQLMYNVPGICVAIEGAQASASFNITVVQHLELLPLIRGPSPGPGSLGKNIRAHRGLVSAVIGEAQAAWHELTKVAGVGEKVLSTAWHVGKDVAKVGGLIASGLALL